MHVEICSACHPFYTGKQKLMDKAGRVERFRRRYENVKKADGKQAEAPAATATEEKPADAPEAATS